MKNNLTIRIFIVLSTMFMLSSCGESVNKNTKTTDSTGKTVVEESSELKAKGGEITTSEGSSNSETSSSEEPIIN